MTSLSIGYIGLGVQGLPLACNLAEAGHNVTGFDVSSDALRALATGGGTAANSAADVAPAAEIIFLCVATDAQLLAVVLGADGLVKSARPGTIIVSHCTVSAKTMAALIEGVAHAGLRLADVPVSGGANGAAQRTMSYMAGCDDEVFEIIEPLLRVSGQSILRTGAAGTATIAKLAHQVTIIGNIMAMAEGMRLGIAGGLDGATVKQVITGGLARSWVAKTWGDVKMAPHALPIYRKDLKNSLSLAEENGVALPGAEAALAHLEAIVP